MKICCLESPACEGQKGGVPSGYMPRTGDPFCHERYPCAMLGGSPTPQTRCDACWQPRAQEQGACYSDGCRGRAVQSRGGLPACAPRGLQARSVAKAPALVRGLRDDLAPSSGGLGSARRASIVQNLKCVRRSVTTGGSLVTRYLATQSRAALCAHKREIMSAPT